MAKINDIRFLARETAKEVSGSPRDWMGYLDTASRLYRYPFSDTLLIHAQRPDATACAELEVWNEKMRRWVNRGAKGIALIDDTGPRRALRYVFDVSDTHPVRGGKTPYLWRMKEEQQEMILNHLADTYGLDGDGASDLAAALRQIAEEMAADSLEEAIRHINRFSTGHSDAILTEDAERAERFLNEVDSACVYVNASTRFTDGFEFGFGAEIGISTQKLHARGPMGLSELTSYKYVIRGNGQIRS